MNAIGRLAAKTGRSTGVLVAGLVVASASAIVLLDIDSPATNDCRQFSGDVGETPCFSATLDQGNLATLSWRTGHPGALVYIYDDNPPAYADPGWQKARCPEHPLGACSVVIPLSEGGHYQWTLAVGAADERVHARAALDLPPPPPPQLVAGGGFVDLLRPSAQVIEWHAGTPRGNLEAWVEIREPGLANWQRHRLPRTGAGAQYEVPASDFHSEGEHVWLIRDCHLPVGSEARLCSPSISVGFYVGYDSFKGIRNRHVVAGELLELEFTEHSGDQRYLSLTGPDGWSDRLGGEPQDSGVTIDTREMAPGRYEIALDACVMPDGPCSNRKTAALAPDTGVFWRKNTGEYSAGALIGTLYTPDGRAPQPVQTTLGGRIEFAQPGPLQVVESGQVLAFETSGTGDLLHLVVSPPVDWELDRPYLEDFYPGRAAAMSGFGEPLEVVFDGEGGIWMLNEFANGVEHFSPDGRVRTLGFPLARHAVGNDFSRLAPVRPFHIDWGGGLSSRSSLSPLAEGAIRAYGKLWFAQGGALRPAANSDTVNASRIISFDPGATDLRATPYDDRFCVYNMPLDAEDSTGNQQVLGIAGARGRIWVAESRGLTSSDETSYLSSFYPSPDLCVALLDFESPDHVEAQPMRYCRDGQTPEQDACVARRAVPGDGRRVKIAHLEADPDERTLWFTDASGQYLGSYDLAGEQGFILRSLRRTHHGERGTIGDLGGFTWDLKVTHDAVYCAEYATREIIRFDKETQRYDEISIPYRGRHVRLHSLALDPVRERLWFSLANECSAPRSDSYSTIGYLDLASWEDYLERPPGRRVEGVVYAGLETIPACEMRPDRHQSFRGIALEPETGRIALATMVRGQLTLLEPLPGFWP